MLPKNIWAMVQDLKKINYILTFERFQSMFTYLEIDHDLEL